MLRTLMLLLMVASGLALGLQIVMNTRVRTALESPAMGAAVSLTVSVVTVALLIGFGLLGGTGNAPAGFRSVPPWAWFGGVCGAFYLVAFVIAMPRIGVASTICATVLGQQLISLCFDTFGWLGATKVPLTPSRLIGAGLLFAGVVLLQRR